MHLNLCPRIQERFLRIDPAVINLERATDSSPVRWWFVALLAMAPLAGANPRIEVVSAPDPSLSVSVSAAGNSSVLGVTPDGSYVLLTSSAHDLVAGVSGRAGIDLYMACRTNGVVTRVSAPARGMSGAHGTSSSGRMTPDGRYVVFESADTDLCTNRVSGAGDVFVRDVQAGTTRLISLNREGRGGGNGVSWSPVITPDGRFVAFVSSASDLVAGDENGIQDIFVRDLRQETTVLVSQGAVAQSNSYLGWSSHSPVITPDGRFVAFTSSDSNLVTSAQAVYQEVYVRDLVKGQTIWASQEFPAPSPVASYYPSLSDDGRYVVFESLIGLSFSVARYALDTGSLEVIAHNVTGHGPSADERYGPVMTPDGRFVVYADAMSIHGSSSLWLWDGQTKSTTLVSANLFGKPTMDGICSTAALTPDGRYVAFLCNGTDLSSQAITGEYQIYRRDVRRGVTELVSVDTHDRAAGKLTMDTPCLSADGRVVAFGCGSGSLVPGDLNDAWDVFVRDLDASTTELVTRRTTDVAVVTANGHSTTRNNALSADGRFVVFESMANNLVPQDTNGVSDVFVRDLQLGTNRLVSINRFGTGSAHGISRNVSISANGRYAVYMSRADDLTPNDTNGLEDVFVRDLQAGTTRLVSVSTNGVSANGASSASAISADGRWVAFQSTATDLAVGQPGSGLPVNVFARDLVAGTTRVTSAQSFVTVDAPVLSSPEGRFLAYRAVSLGELYSDLYVTDLQTGAFLTFGSNVLAKAFSGDGRKLAYLELDVASLLNWLVVADLIQGSQTRLPLGSGKMSTYAALSANFDGRWVALSSLVPWVGPGTNAFENLFLCDVPNANLVLASVNRSGTGGGDGASGSPRISADGRYVAFRSAARDLVAGEERGLECLFDRLTGQTTLLSPSTDAVLTSPNASAGLELTADASKVVFSSSASDLVSGDFNGAVDIFTAEIEPTTPPGETPTIRLAETSQQGGVTTIRWSAAPGRSYRVEYRDSLEASGWQNLPGVVVIVGAEAWLADGSGTHAPQRFYRVRRVE